MKAVERIVIPKDLLPKVELYCENNAKRLYDMVDKILFKLHFTDVDKNDFYSLANEVFMYTVRDYDASKSFDGFLYSCLYKKFCTEMTRRCRKKRKGEKTDISIDAPIGDDEGCTIGDMIASDFTIEKELFEKNEDGYSKRMLAYLDRLSTLQKEVLKLNIAGYLPNEIREELHITEKQYTDCYSAIHSYRNVSVLF